MENTITILVNKDKTLQKTKYRNIYEKENRADTIQFLIDKDFFEYNEEDSTIQFFSNGAPIGSPIKIDDEISWKNWS